MFDADPSFPASKELRSRVDLMEERLCKFFGRFAEMPAETLAILSLGLNSEQAFPPPKESAAKKPEEKDAGKGE